MISGQFRRGDLVRLQSWHSSDALFRLIAINGNDVFSGSANWLTEMCEKDESIARMQGHMARGFDFAGLGIKKEDHSAYYFADEHEMIIYKRAQPITYEEFIGG